MKKTIISITMFGILIGCGLVSGFYIKQDLNRVNDDLIYILRNKPLNIQNPFANTFQHQNYKKMMGNLNHYNGGPNEEWNNTFGGGLSDNILDAERTSDGNYVICGSTQSFSNSNGENEDGWLLKINENGYEIFNKTFDRYNNDVLTSVSETSDHGFILSGYTVSTEDNADILIIKTDENGIEFWNKTFGGRHVDYSFSTIIETDDNGFILSGFSNSFGNYQGDIWILKIDSNGNEQWNRTLGGNQMDYATDIIPAHDSGYIILANTYSYGMGNSDCWIIKIDNNGNELWNYTFGGNFYEGGESIVKTEDGNYIVGGISEYVIDAENDYFYLDFDMWIFKIDTAGNLLWETKIGDRFLDEFISSIDLSANSGFLISGRVDHLSNGKRDALLIKIDNNGNVEWKSNLRGKNNQMAVRVLQTEDQDYMVFGITDSFGNGGYDAWMILLSYFENIRPYKPNIPIGSSNVKIMRDYEYSCSGTEPEGQQIYYKFNWGDGYDSGWLGPYNSNQNCVTTYYWTEQGNLEIKVKISDIHGGESDWSDPLELEVSKNKIIDNWLFFRLINQMNSFNFLNNLINLLEGLN